jgi:hypothetical protein
MNVPRTPASASKTSTPDPQVPPVLDRPRDWWPSEGTVQPAEFASLEDAVPVLFLPVRLETRFTDAKPKQARQLKVRIYPDQIHVDDHEPGLTRREREIGRAYWKAWKSATAARDEAAQTEAREWLVAQLTARRAAWVARQTAPDRKGSPKGAEEARAPRATCLPRRWALVGFTRQTDGSLDQAFVVWTTPIREDLRAGVDLTSYGVSKEVGSLPVDDGMAWMVDYDEAVAAGMAVTIDLADHPTVARDGLAVLLAVGVSTTGSDEGVDELTALLQAHLYSDGLAFAPQGTPTNNTDQVDSPWSFRETDPLALLARELDGADEATEPASNGKRAAAALGRADHPLFGRLEHAADDEETAQAAMNRVLWPVTWGQYFDHLLAGVETGSAVPYPAISNLEQRFIDDVRGGAPLPGLRVGAQPYGLLPVRFSQPAERWMDASPWFEYVLHYFRQRWLEAADTVVPRMDPVLGASGGTASNDPDSVLMEILSNLPHPARFLVRELRSWRTTDTENIDDFGDIILSALLPFLYYDDPTFGYEALSVLGRWGWALEVLGGSDHFGIPQSELRPLDDPTLRGADEQIEALRDLRGRVNSLLTSTEDRDGARVWIDSMITLVEQHKDRQAPLLEIAPGSLDIEEIIADEVDDPTLFYSVYGRDEDSALFELPLVHSPFTSTANYLRILRDRVPDGIGHAEPEKGDVLGRADAIDTAAGVRRGIPRVAGRQARRRPGRQGRQAARRTEIDPQGPGEVVDSTPGPLGGSLPPLFGTAKPLLYQLLDSVVEDVGTLAANAYKSALDALAGVPADQLELRLRETLGLASHRLDAFFTSMARRRLDALRAASGGLQIGGYGWVVDLAPDDAGALDSQGFIHAPSIPQATTAAILRSGWSAHGSADDQSVMAVDLRSDRVGTAAWLLDAVRQGQSLGEALGYRFERELHDAFLDAWIDPVRRAVLLDGGIGRDPRGSVDGLDLLDLWSRSKTPSDLIASVPSEHIPRGSPDVLEAHLETVAAALDAAGDAAIAESVHQVAQGNMTRAAATLDAINLGEVAPPELGELRTPIAGTGVTHRLVALLGGTERTEGWGKSARSIFDPALEAWVSRLLGPATNAFCHTRWIDGGGTASWWEPLSMAELGISALDAAFEAPTAAPTQGSAWARRVEAAVRDKTAVETPEDFRVEIDFGLAPDGALSMTELAESARLVRTLLGRSRALDARDLDVPGETAAATNVAGIVARATDLERAFRKSAAALLKLLPEERVDDKEPNPVGGASAEVLRATMRELAAYGLLGALPAAGYSGTEADTARLRAAAWSLGRKVTKRIARLDDVRGGVDEGAEATAEGALGQATRIVRIILGRAFPVVPHFAPSAMQPVDALFASSDALTGGDRAAISNFVTQAGRVRPDTATFDELTLVSETLQGGLVATLAVGQRPEVAGEAWVANRLPEPETGGRVHWIVVDHGGIEAAAKGSAAGLLIDEWVERIPASRQSTGVAFHFDAPASRPPQSLLLAVTPDDEQGWDFDLVVATLLQTLEDARLRAVAPQALTTYGHHLPAIFPPARLQTAASS